MVLAPMMDFNIDLMLGFLIWTVFCLTMLIVEHFRARKWKRIAKEQARALGLMRRRSKWWDSIPTGVIVHPNKEPLLHNADEPTLMDIMALGKLESYDDDSK